MVTASPSSAPNTKPKICFSFSLLCGASELQLRPIDFADSNILHLFPERFGAPPVRGKGDNSHPTWFASITNLLPACIQRTPGNLRKEGCMTTLDNFKKSAKRWLKTLRANHPEARARFERAFPNAPANPGLRDVQHALALEHGFDGWTALKNKLSEQPTFAPMHPEATPDDLAARFLEFACPDHHIRGPSAHSMAIHAAARMLKRHPEIARHSLYTAIVCGEIDEVERILRERPELATAKSSATAPDRSAVGGSGDIFKDIGPKGWDPLLYLCFTRLSLAKANDNAVAIAKLLLNLGADSNCYFMAGDSLYTPLVGVIGEGEEDRPPHPRRDELTRLLLEHGANPYDMQVFYNIHFHGEIVWYLDLIYPLTVGAGHKSDWDDPEWRMMDEGGYGHGARYLLTIAVNQNNPKLAEWLLSHGASPDPAPAPHPKMPKTSVHEQALRRGCTEIADMLVRYGANPSGFVPPPVEEFHFACMQLDRGKAEAMLKDHPEYLREPGAMHAAAKRNRVDVIAFLLDLGMSIEIENPKEGRQRPLHVAAYSDSLKAAAFLIERGAEIDPIETKWNNTPLDFAVYGQIPRMIEFLGRFSKDIWNLVYVGNVDRVREILRTDPQLARVTAENGATPLMWLPDDESRAIEIIELMVANGCNPAAVTSKGMAAADFAQKRAMDDVTAVLRAKADAARSG
jgi:ankyrin repeat protein